MVKKGSKSVAAAPAPAAKKAAASPAIAKSAATTKKGKAPVPVEEPESESEEDEELDGDEEDWSDDDDEEMEDGSDDDEDEDEDEDEDDETGGVTESAMRKLMKALGEDGLDEIARAQLGEDDEEDEEEDGEDSEGEEEGSEEDEEMDTDDEEEEESSTLTNAQLLGLEAADDGDDIDAEGMLDLHELGSDVSVDEDAVPVRKVTVVRRPALKALRERLMVSDQPFDQTLVLVGGSVDDFADVDAGDDLKREVAFYKQALSVVGRARKLAAKHDVPFTRPRDYYAEMVKTDSHMERVRSRLVDEASSIKKSEQAKRQRELKKYGKQIQQEKLKQRADDRKSFDERVKGIKRKRAGGAEIGGGDDFGVELDDVMEGRGGGARGGRGGGRGDKTKMPRHARDAKYGMGGKGRRSKQNDRESTNDFGSGGRGGFGGGRGGRGGAGGGRGGGRGGGKSQRPGKSRRSGGGRS